MTIKLSHGFANVEKNRFGSYLHLLMVDTEYRGNGIATKLMARVLDKAPRPIYLLTDGAYGADVERLIEFYSRFGFVCQKQRKSEGYPYNYNMVLY